MKRVISFFIFLSGLCTLHTLNAQKADPKIKEKVSVQILSSLKKFKSENLKQLQLVENKEKIRSQLLKTRQAYKQCEYYLGIGNAIEFRKINGPNLNYDAFRGGASQLVQPRGLQSMEEILFQDTYDALAYKREVEKLDTLLGQIYGRGKNLDKVPDESFHQIIWEALKFEVYRIEALGITGFDTPFSQWGISEVKPAMEGMLGIIKIYSGSKFLTQKQAAELSELLTSSIKYTLKNTDFNSFNRLYFLQEYLHPVSEQIHQIQTNNGWIYQVRKSGVNPQARNLWDYRFFENDFFRYRSSPSLVEAGRALFHDKRLSPGNQMSCASCHIPKYGFGDTTAFSTSISGKPLRRNTPGLWNLAFQTKFYLDGRVLRIEDQFMEVIHNPEEMGSSLDFIAAYIENDPAYLALFKNAMGRRPGKFEILAALEAYVRGLFSFNSAFDRYMRKESKDLKPEVINGFNLFTGKAKCASCHFMPLFNGLLPPFYDETEFEVLGTPILVNGQARADTDMGRYEKTGVEFHKQAFKTSGIRNVHLNAPFMHNGVFKSLNEVVLFYNNGGGNGNGIPTVNQTLPSDSLKLSPKEIQDIISFMKALEDTSSTLK